MGWSPEKGHKMFGKADFFWSRNTNAGPQERRLGDACWDLLRPASAEAGAGSRFSISQKQTLVSNASVKFYKVCFCSGVLGGPTLSFPLGTTVLDSPYRCMVARRNAPSHRQREPEQVQRGHHHPAASFLGWLIWPQPLAETLPALCTHLLLAKAKLHPLPHRFPHGLRERAPAWQGTRLVPGPTFSLPGSSIPNRHAFMRGSRTSPDHRRVGAAGEHQPHRSLKLSGLGHCSSSFPSDDLSHLLFPGKDGHAR